MRKRKDNKAVNKPVNKPALIIGIILLIVLMIAVRSLLTKDAKKGARGDENLNESTVQDENVTLPETERYDITLGFAGDICFADNYTPMQHLAALGTDHISAAISQDYIDDMRSMSLMWINNEFVYSDRGEPLPGKMYTFRSTPSHVKYLDDLGIDIVGLANNHVYDYGPDAFEDTLTTLENDGMPYVGAGHNLSEAMSPVYLKADGFTIAYVAASRAEKLKMTPQATETEGGILRCYDNELFLQAIREARANADFVIALPHWGTEHSTVLEEAQTSGAREYIEAGADAVIGAHPHILQGIEYVEGKPVVYSLGNFWFDDYSQDTMIAELHLTGEYEAGLPSLASGNVELRIIPGTQIGVETRKATDPDLAKRILHDLEDISVNVSIDENGIVRENDLQ